MEHERHRSHIYKKVIFKFVSITGITLLAIVGKMLAKQLLGRLNNLDQRGLISESQYEFRKDKGTVDMIFAGSKITLETCQEQNVDQYMVYVDLTKAFGTVIRNGLWKIMIKFGCPPRFTAMVR